jgi:hypothetical protein
MVEAHRSGGEITSAAVAVNNSKALGAAAVAE